MAVANESDFKAKELIDIITKDITEVNCFVILASVDDLMVWFSG